LASNHALRAVVEELLVERWSPQQIAGRLRRTYPGDEEMHVSHETIYLTLFIQARGGLKRELTKHLRTRRANRRPKGARPPSGKGQIVDPVMISERPAAVEDRAVPGHWEGDLIMGKRQTAIGTLVERWSRYVMLFPLPDGHTAEAVRVALEATVQRLPEHLWQSLTWDQGKEMAQHAQFTVDTGVQARSTSATRSRRGNAARTRTRTGCCVNTSRKAPTCPSIPNTISMPLHVRSTVGLDKPSDG
jgi:IS30 family transposase